MSEQTELSSAFDTDAPLQTVPPTRPGRVTGKRGKPGGADAAADVVDAGGEAKPAKAAKVPKPPRETIKGLITGALEAGTPRDEIIEMIQSKHPGTKAAENPNQHIDYYVGKLLGSHKLDEDASYREGILKYRKPRAARTARTKKTDAPDGGVEVVDA